MGLALWRVTSLLLPLVSCLWDLIPSLGLGVLTAPLREWP